MLERSGHTSLSDAIAVAMHTDEAFPKEPRVSYSNQVFQKQLAEIWPGIDTCYSQVDWTFQDWFDYELPGTELPGTFDHVPR